MDISAEELGNIVSKSVADALAKERANFRVPEKQHFLDHEKFQQCQASMDVWAANHRFVTDIRESFDDVKRSAFKSMLYLLGIGIVLACSFVFAKIKGWI